MKIMIRSIVAILMMVIGFSFSTKALAVDMPIQSKDTIRNYALGQVVRGARSVSSSSMVYDDNSVIYASKTGNGAEDVLNQLFAVEFKYKVANPLDKIEGHVWLYDKDNNLVFYGYASYLVSEIGKYGPPQYNIWIQRVAIGDQVQSAEILVIGDDGNTVRKESVSVNNNRVLFDTWMAGVPNGILSIRFTDGNVMTYNLWDAKGNTPGATNERNGSWKIEGHYVFELSPKDVALVKIVEVYNKPTVLITVTKGQVIRFDISGLVQDGAEVNIEHPFALSFSQVGGPWTGAGKFNSEYTVVFPADGTYRVKFDWVDFQKPGKLYTGPSDGGKG